MLDATSKRRVDAARTPWSSSSLALVGAGPARHRWGCGRAVAGERERAGCRRGLDIANGANTPRRAGGGGEIPDWRVLPRDPSGV